MGERLEHVGHGEVPPWAQGDLAEDLTAAAVAIDRLTAENEELRSDERFTRSNEAIEAALAENARLREALRRLLDRMTDRGSIGGVDSHLRTTWFSVAEVERLRASLSETGGE